jgi:hypothetical protein
VKTKGSTKIEIEGRISKIAEELAKRTAIRTIVLKYSALWGMSEEAIYNYIRMVESRMSEYVVRNGFESIYRRAINARIEAIKWAWKPRQVKKIKTLKSINAAGESVVTGLQEEKIEVLPNMKTVLELEKDLARLLGLYPDQVPNTLGDDPKEKMDSVLKQIEAAIRSTEKLDTWPPENQ